MMIICMESKAIKAAGLILAFLSCCWSHRLQIRYSGLDKLLGNHCLDSFGNMGICMFKWECLSKDGAMLSTCVDGFLFGACCALKTGDLVEGDSIAHQQQENNIPNAISSLRFRPLNSSLIDGNKTPEKDDSKIPETKLFSNPKNNSVQVIGSKTESHERDANNNKTFKTGYLENNNSSFTSLTNISNMSKSLLLNSSVSENFTDVPTNTENIIIDYFSEPIYGENDSTNFQPDLKDSHLKKHSISDQLFSIILRKNNFSKLGLEENVFSYDPSPVNLNSTHEYENNSASNLSLSTSETIDYFTYDDVEAQKNMHFSESLIFRDTLNNSYPNSSTFSNASALSVSKNLPSFFKNSSNEKSEIKSFFRTKERPTNGQGQGISSSELHSAHTDRNPNRHQDTSTIPSNFQEVLNQLIFSNENVPTSADTQNYEGPIDLEHLESQPHHQITSAVKVDSRNESIEIASDTDTDVSQTSHMTEAYGIDFDNFQNEVPNQSPNLDHSSPNESSLTYELFTQRYPLSDVSQVLSVTMCSQEFCGKEKNDSNKKIQKEPTEHSSVQQTEKSLQTVTSATEVHRYTNDYQFITDLQVTVRRSDALSNNLDENQYLSTVPSSFTFSPSIVNAYINSESKDGKINQSTDWLVSQNVATTQSAFSQYTTKNLGENNEIVQAEDMSITTQYYEGTTQTSFHTDIEMNDFTIDTLTASDAHLSLTDFEANSLAMEYLSTQHSTTGAEFSTQRVTEESPEPLGGDLNTIERMKITDSAETTQLFIFELSTTIPSVTNTSQEGSELLSENNFTTVSSTASGYGASPSADTDPLSDSTSADSQVDLNEVMDTNYSVPFITSYNQETTPLNYKWDYKKECGVRPMQAVGRIVGGQNTYLGKWPWQALVKEATWLGLFVKNKCGGVLISSKYVLTAAHCQPGFLASLLVLLGTHDLKENTAPVIRNVKRMVVHRNYNPLTFENDLAILEMDSELEFLPYVIPICLPQSDEDFTGKMAFVTGWGKLTHGGDVPNILQEVQVPIVTNKDCQRMFYQAGHQKAIQNNFVCAGYRNGGQDSCEGDSGGPLMVQRQDKRWVLVGTVSHGIGCADPNLPGVYMRMSSYIAWIDSIIKKT